MPQLNADQQEKLSRIMSVPTKTTSPAGMGSSVPVLQSYQVSDLQNLAPNSAQAVTTVPPVARNQITAAKVPEQKKSRSALPILLIIVGVVLFVGYVFFWLKFFTII